MTKVSDLEGADLDSWVALAEGWVAPWDLFIADWKDANGVGVTKPLWLQSRRLNSKFLYSVPGFHQDWSQGGPIIEREGIKLLPPQGDRSHWLAEVFQGKPHFGWAEAGTPLIAAMRAFVASKFGDEVLAGE